jgi:hypothetical protein
LEPRRTEADLPSLFEAGIRQGRKSGVDSRATRDG